MNHAPSREQLLLMCQSVAQNLKSNGRFVGLNNNIFQAPSSYQTSLKYGLLKSLQGELSEGCPITVTFQVPNSTQTFSVTDYYLSEATYQWAFSQAGLSELKISDPQVSEEGIVALGADFWQDLLTYPPMIILEANKLSN